ncbi:MAG: carbonic anhydrase [Caulobacter sp.]
MNCGCAGPGRWPVMSRRMALAGALGAGLAAAAAPGISRAGGHCEALLLTCMDYRLANEVTGYMDARGLRDKYDHVILAGASLGALNDRFPQWNEIFMGHLALAVQLHEVHRVIILDHRDCGAYKLILGDAAVKDAETEFRSHVRQLYALRSAITTKHPHMEVEIGLMDLDGKVTQIV